MLMSILNVKKSKKLSTETKGEIDLIELTKKTDQVDRVSVVVPVYNVELYLNRCIESIQKQAYKNLEIILIDDGSTDASPRICDDYASKDYDVVVVHKKNNGLSSARNTGNVLLIGDYVSYIDSDDYIAESFVSCLIAFAKKYCLDIAQTKIVITTKPIKFPLQKKQLYKFFLFCGKFAPNSYLYKVSACAKLYKRCIIQSISFPEKTIHEDEATYYRYAYVAQKIGLLDFPGYFYYQSQNSTMRNLKENKSLDYLKVYYDRIAYYMELNEIELLNGTYERFCLVLMLNYISYIKRKTNANDLPMLVEIFREHFLLIKNTKHVGLFRRFIYELFSLKPYLIAKLLLLFGLVR